MKMLNTQTLQVKTNTTFNKTHIKLRVDRCSHMTDETWARVPYQFKRISDRKAKRMSFVIKPAVEDISTPYKIAKVVRENFGYGEFILLFYNRLNLNKKHNHRYLCIENGCDNNRLKTFRRERRTCKHKSNNRLWPDFCGRGRVFIYPREASSINPDDDFGFKWFTEHDKMYRFWFWKGIQGDKQSGRVY